MAELVNVVAGGDFPVEFDLEFLYDEINTFPTQYSPEIQSGLQFELEDIGVTVMLFQPGSYHLTGGSSINEIFSAHDKLVSIIVDLVDFPIDSVSGPEIRNLVYVDNLDRELDLASIDLDPTIESTEYDPNEFPGLKYRPNNQSGVFMVFRTGKVVLVGIDDPSIVEGLFDNLSDAISEKDE